MTFEIPESLWTILFIALLCSVIQTALMQKLKELPFITKGAVTWIVNLAFSIALGIAFAMYFFNLDLYAGMWVGFLCFLGASAIYEGILRTKHQIETKSDVVDIETIETVLDAGEKV